MTAKVTPISSAPATPIQTGIRNNWTRVRPSFFRGLARRLKYTEDKLFGLVLDSSVGYGQTWAKVGWRRILEVCHVTRRQCETALAKLVADGLIRSRKAAIGNGFEYAIATRPDGEACGIAKCRGCGETSEVDLDNEFLPVPHSFFVSLPARCDRGMYLTIKIIVARTMAWDRDTKQIAVQPREMSIEDFTSATGLKRSEVIEDLQKLVAAGFAGAERVGRSIRYWARPENFAAGVERPLRHVEQPKREKKNKAAGPAVEKAPLVAAEVIDSPLEFVTLPCGVCRKCGCYGPMDLVDVEKKAPKKPVTAVARAGPPKTDRAYPEKRTVYEKTGQAFYEIFMKDGTGGN